MTKATRYQKQELDAVQKSLRALPRRDRGLTRKQAAAYLADDIRKAMKKGYTLKDIQTLCAKAGVPLSLASMHKVLLHEPNDAPCEGVSAQADADAQV